MLSHHCVDTGPPSVAQIRPTEAWKAAPLGTPVSVGRCTAGRLPPTWAAILKSSHPRPALLAFTNVGWGRPFNVGWDGAVRSTSDGVVGSSGFNIGWGRPMGPSRFNVGWGRRWGRPVSTSDGVVGWGRPVSTSDGVVRFTRFNVGWGRPFHSFQRRMGSSVSLNVGWGRPH